MSNDYSFEMKLAGRERTVAEMIAFLKHRLTTDIDIKEMNSPEGSQIICADLTGSATLPLSQSVKALAEACRRLGVVLEAFGEDQAVQEHLLVDRGEIMAAARALYKAHHIPSLSEREVEDLLFEEGYEMEDLLERTDGNDIYRTGGLEEYGNFQDVIAFLEYDVHPFMEYTDSFGDTVYVTPRIAMYRDFSNLYLGLSAFDEDSHVLDYYSDVTVNIDPLPYLHGAIDTNNNGQAVIDFLEKEGIAEPAGYMIPSGFCLFPVYRFNEEKLLAMDPKGFAEYAKEHRKEVSLRKPALDDMIAGAEEKQSKKCGGTIGKKTEREKD